MQQLVDFYQIEVSAVPPATPSSRPRIGLWHIKLSMYYWIESIRRQHPRNFSFLLHASQTLRAIKDIAIGSAKHHEVHQFLHTHFESMDFKSDVCKHLWRTGKSCVIFEVDSALQRISKSMLLTHFNTAQLATSCTWVQYPWPPIIAPDFGSSKSRSLQPSTPRVLPLPLYLCKRFAICSISLLKHYKFLSAIYNSVLIITSSTTIKPLNWCVKPLKRQMDINGHNIQTSNPVAVLEKIETIASSRHLSTDLQPFCILVAKPWKRGTGALHIPTGWRKCLCMACKSNDSIIPQFPQKFFVVLAKSAKNDASNQV